VEKYEACYKERGAMKEMPSIASVFQADAHPHVGGAVRFQQLSAVWLRLASCDMMPHDASKWPGQNG